MADDYYTVTWVCFCITMLIFSLVFLDSLGAIELDDELVWPFRYLTFYWVGITVTLAVITYIKDKKE
jgi:hypothetical protein